MEAQKYIVPLTGTLIGALGVYGFQWVMGKIQQKHRKNKKSHKASSTANSASSNTKNEQSSSDETDVSGDTILKLPHIYTPRLVSAPIRTVAERAFDLLKEKFPEQVEIVPFRYFFPLSSSTLTLLSLTPEITEPMIAGHPQTIYNTFLYPVKSVLQNASISRFWFEVIHQNTQDPLLEWSKSAYKLDNFKPKAKTNKITHAIPLFIASLEDRIQDPFLAKLLFVRQFTHSSRCLNSLPMYGSMGSSSSSSSQSTISKIVPANAAPLAVLVFCVCAK
ncbi:uncharacterized protein MONOS_10658 [Monocercomonoides exilis]|uniref:uncharacterized protein n=1 Tax=Monocercomonoides exilis TaxID=2049356 RepID=UPI00355A0A3D|nr:hypothetical protein MONOS_10658 [Monocercomonoides exilis]|eukprot:MONOS_10658.1-p1 / transcript=MONOS_10658.1 / gene=MONOS_10658 / organism=Monocercomonoides_exilis_PA203 / gene_product=unspecified product / transcript_product=unspecified product / location=Mono_scaffold00492:45615-46609(-) / protein_length=277 / sequence_SO=supercontig / SO=protein_coding / is_pseudo=false